jgi:hypothetical protein
MKPLNDRDERLGVSVLKRAAHAASENGEPFGEIPDGVRNIARSSASFNDSHSIPLRERFSTLTISRTRGCASFPGGGGR